MPLHPLAAHFAGVADAYERGRPDHPPAVVEALAVELRLAPGAKVLDLAAGTGKLTRALVAAGLDVTAVEPLGELRGILAGVVGPERALEGVAEDIPLEDGSVDAVTVADAFHWFDQPVALAEIRRVLRPGGRLALLSTAPDWSAASWAHELGQLVLASRPEHPQFDGPPWPQVIRADGAWNEPREIRVSVKQPGGRERVVDYLGSISWIAGLEPARRAELLARIGEIVAGGDMPAELGMTFVILATELA